MKFYLGIFLFISLNIFSQSKVSVNGYVFSSFGKEAMIGVQVFDSNTGINTITNQYGYFSINLLIKDSINLNFYYSGYEFKTILINKNSKNNLLTVYLSEVINLEEIVISNTINNVNNNEISTLGVKIEDIKKMPALFGESDIIKAIQQTPGVQSGGDAKSNIFVRGGASDQNLLLLDDVPIYQIAHFGGFFSVFNIDAINDVKLIKGGFPSRYGGRLSSVLEVRLKDGNKNEFKASGAIGVFSSRLTLEGPIQKNKSSYLISARRSTPFIFNFSGIKYHFYDLNAKLNFELSPKDKLFIIFFRGNDGLLL